MMKKNELTIKINILHFLDIFLVIMQFLYCLFYVIIIFLNFIIKDIGCKIKNKYKIFFFKIKFV